MTIGVALEAFEHHSQYRTETPSAARDEFSLSYAEYGVRVGVWRLLDLFTEEGLHASFSISGLLAQQHPEIIRAIVESGHDVVGHGWANDLLMSDAGPEAERDIVARTLVAIESAGGRRPTGWSSPGNLSSEHTRNILLDEGVTWSGDDASDDVPFVEDVGNRRLAILPKVNLDSNDLIQWVKQRNAPSVFAESFRSTFDTLHSEGVRGASRWSEMTLHAHMAGRPTLIPWIRSCIAHAKSHERVWWTTKSEIAAWTLDQDFRR
jgi:peptidoglycan/xylan/chitin deacetylase (PgdA/CDA1 family)